MVLLVKNRLNYQQRFVYSLQNSGVKVVNTVGTAGSQYSSNDYGSEELKQGLESKIYSSDFFKNADESNLKLLADGILSDSLSREEKEQLLLDALQKAVNTHKGSMVLNREFKSSKPDGSPSLYG